MMIDTSLFFQPSFNSKKCYCIVMAWISVSMTFYSHHCLIIYQPLLFLQILKTTSRQKKTLILLQMSMDHQFLAHLWEYYGIASWSWSDNLPNATLLLQSCVPNEWLKRCSRTSTNDSRGRSS